jgi:hypothetical protein
MNKTKRQNQRGKVRSRRVGRNDNPAYLGRTMTLSKVIPDRVRCVYESVSVPVNIFNSLGSRFGLPIYMNSMLEVYSGLNANFHFFSTGSATTGLAQSYRKYRVTKSKIELTVANREATDTQHLYLVPALSAVNSTPTDANVAALTSLPFCKQKQISGTSGGTSFTKMIAVCNPAKLIGPHYYEQDEYAANTNTLANPSVLLYWNFLAYNTDANTATTGGLVLGIKLTQTVDMYEPDRDESLSLESINNKIKSLKAVQKSLQATSI